MALTLNETLNETLTAEEQTAFEEAITPALLTQPSTLPALPMIDGKPLRFASPAPEPTEAPASVFQAARKNVYGDPLGKWFDYALLTLLLTCAATSAVLLISTTLP